MCRGRACPVPCRVRRCVQGGTGTSPAPTGPAPSPSVRFNAFLVGDGLVPSRAESVDAFRTGGDKPRPYGAGAESIGALQRILRRGRACPVPCRIRRCVQGRAGTSPAPTGPAPSPSVPFNAFLVGDGLVPSRAESVDAFRTGGDKPRPYGAGAESVGAFQRIPRRGRACPVPCRIRRCVQGGRGQAPPLRGRRRVHRRASTHSS